jgi:hypothetical protein
MSELLREVARSMRREAQTSDRHPVAVAVVILYDDGKAETACFSELDAADEALEQLPVVVSEATRRMTAEKLADEAIERARCYQD